MVQKAKEYLKEENINAVIGGFHIFNPINRKNESCEYLDLLTSEINKRNSIFFTGHCIGLKNFNFLKEKLKHKIQPMNAGEVIAI